MVEIVEIVEVVKDGDDGMLVTFSDGTTAGYIADELLELRPIREKLPRRQVEDGKAKRQKSH